MPRSKSSEQWLRRQAKDPYVKRARQEGYRSRAAYKLLEIQERSRILKPGMTVIDLGATPGGWCQVTKRLIGRKGRLIALDVLPMDPIPDVEFIQGDFSEDEALDQLMATLDGMKIDVVLSDIAPNISGIPAVDQPRSMYLVELVCDFAFEVLKPGGTLLTKVFQGEGFEGAVSLLRERFSKVVIRKPKSSRQQSKEMYVCASQFK